MEAVAAIPSNYIWAPTTSDIDHSMTFYTSVSNWSKFSTNSQIIGASFGVGTEFALHPTVAFDGDAFGVFSDYERPRKALGPNWHREEIIKNKASNQSFVPKVPKEGSQFIEEESGDKSSRMGDQVDSKNIDSSRSTEHEDEVEAARSTERTVAEDASEKSTAAGDVLDHASYNSDDEDEEI
ncbi:Hypothetical predicted protein [Olea europaea subsp. europaea]|uniref:Uncharacterized protein n=1 Tax=Olea europaea subsp. europaea TaxID=158383 RepID=A0A8S0VPW2_OLEEU|nr:Hypothetical predicted protein [Olea europaea subsp. europaea]